MRLIAFVLLAVITLSGCVTRKMFDDEKLPEQDASIIYSNSSSSGPFIRTKINGKKIGGGLFTPKRALLSPGVHELEIVVYISRGMLRSGEKLANGDAIPRDFSFLRRYKFEIPMKPGHSYLPDHPGWSLDTQKFKMCITGEPHDAEGSAVAWTNEERRMSKNADEIVCETPNLLISHEGRVENPESLPASLSYHKMYLQ